MNSGSRQTGEVIAGVPNTIATLADEMAFVFFAEAHERGRYSAQRGCVIFYGAAELLVGSRREYFYV